MLRRHHNIFVKHLLCPRLLLAVGKKGLLPSWQAGEVHLDLMAEGWGPVASVWGRKEVSGLPSVPGGLRGEDSEGKNHAGLVPRTQRQ